MGSNPSGTVIEFPDPIGPDPLLHHKGAIKLPGLRDVLLGNSTGQHQPFGLY